MRVGLLIVLLTFLVNLLGPPIGFFLLARREAREIPGVKIIPHTLTDYSTSAALGTTLSYLGYEFEVPWNTRYTEKAGRGRMALFKFESGQDVVFIVPANQAGLLSEIVQDKSSGLRGLQPVFGDLANSSAYDQYAVLLNTTPQNIRAFGSRAEAVRGISLLTVKAVAFGPGLETGVLSFDLPDKRGFQIGDPTKSKRIDLEIFETGGRHVEISCGTSKDNIRFSQPEINRILISFHSVAPGSSVAPAARVTALPN